MPEKRKRNPDLARREGETDAEYFKRRFEMALANQAKAAEAKQARLAKRIETQKGVVAKATARLAELEKEYEALKTPEQPELPLDEPA